MNTDLLGAGKKRKKKTYTKPKKIKHKHKKVKLAVLKFYKCEGDKALCARCLHRGMRHEESAIHEYHDCPAIREGVWKPLASAWLAATGDAIDIESPLLTVAGLRLAPATLTGDARKRFDAREPAWRLLHSAALLPV